MSGRSRTIDADGVLGAVAEVRVPEPGPDEVLMRLEATSINYHDLIGLKGGIPNVKLPRVPFSDGCGTIVRVGADVDDFAPGDRVIPGFFPDWAAGPPTSRNRARVLGDQIDGTLQTHLCLPARSIVRAASNLSARENATLGCAGLTAWRALVVEGGLRPGHTIVIQGTGGVSLFALGLAKMMGARTIVTSSSDEKLEHARVLGADVMINYRTTPDWDQVVLDQTDGGAELIVEVGGGDTLARSVNAARVNGHISVIGVLGGFQAASFPLATVMRDNLHVVGITVGNIAQLDALCRAIELHDYHPTIDSTFDLASTEAAVALMQSQRHFGKIAIDLEH